MRIERYDTLTAALRTSLAGLVEEAAAAGQELGEAKAAQLTEEEPRWSGVVAWEGAAAVGYAHVRWGRPGEVPAASTELLVHPDREDATAIAGGLLGHVRALAAAAGGGTLFVWAHRVRDPGHTLPAAAGLDVQRQLAVMDRELGTPPPPGTAPEGVTLAPYRPGPDDDELLRVNNAAFSGHPEQGGWDAATLRERARRSWFDPDDVILAWRDGRLLGFHWTKLHRRDPGAPAGEVYVLAVAPDAQGLGLGRLLLRTGLAHLHARGCRTALLYVDLASAGAVRLYESEGFAIRHLEVCYAEDVAPA